MKKIIQNIRSKKDFKKEINLIDQALVSGGNFLISILITRLMGIENFGLYSAGFVLIYLFFSIHNAWIISPMLSLKPKKENEIKSKYTEGLFYHHILFAIVSSIITYMIVLLPYSDSNPLYGKSFAAFLPLLTFLYLTHEYYRRSFFSEENVTQALICDLIAYGIQIPSIIVICFVNPSSLTLIMLASCAGFICSSFYGFLCFRPSFKNIKLRITTTGLENWKFARWLVGTSLLQWGAGNFFLIAAATLLTPAAFGAINLAGKIIDGFGVIFRALENHVVVRSAKIYKHDGLSSLVKYMKRIVVLGLPITIISSIVIILLAKWIMILFAGEQSIQYTILLQLFAVHYIFVFIGYPLRFLALTINKNQISFFAYVISGVFSAIFAFSIIEKYGPEGVVMGVITTNIISLLWFTFSLRKEIFQGLYKKA